MDVTAGLPGVYISSTAWGDYDNDGDLDILLTGFTGSEYISRIYRNDSGSFVDVVAGLTGVLRPSAAWGDYDNDGDLDILLVGDHASRVYRNNSGAFVDIEAELPPVRFSSAAWGDYDNDGDLDILLTGEAGPENISRVYRNDAGVFVDIGAQLTGVIESSVAWGDCDGDGDLDILLTGRTGSEGVSLSLVYRNDGGSFVDISAGLTGAHSSSVAWGDYDNDGDLDILLTGYDGSTGISRVYRNDGGSFVDISAGLTGVYRSSAAWGDHDNDGDLDILLTGRVGYSEESLVYRNDGGNFADIEAGLPGAYISACAWGDYDNDGDLDMLLTGTSTSQRISRVYRNDAAIAPNTAPSAPTNLSAHQDASALTLSWDAAADTETPVAGLTYNLRVGTTPGGDEVFAAMADPPSGYRRIPMLGNVQQQLSWSLDISSLAGGTTLYWSVQSVDTAFAGSAFAGEETLVLEVGTSAPALQTRFALHANVPNPFNPSTTIRFDLPQPGRVELTIYDMAGRRVRTLVQESRQAGRHQVIWRGLDESGRRVGSGVYLLRLEAGPFIETRRMTLLK